MLSGRRLDLLDPSALDIEVEDIAHGLARVARWNGRRNGAHIFSVAQHSLLVEALAHKRVPGLDRGRPPRPVLLHDAPEYVIGDMISPFKAVIGDAYKTIERGSWRRSIGASACRQNRRRELEKLNQDRRPPSGFSEAYPAPPASTLLKPADFSPAATGVGLARTRLPQAMAGRDSPDPLSGAFRQAFCRRRGNPPVRRRTFELLFVAFLS